MTKNINNQKQENQFDNFQEQIVSAVREGRPLLGKEGVFTPLIKHALEAAAEAEMDEHLVGSKITGEENRRNGKSSKLMKSELGSFELETPRDRASDFEPQLV